MLSEFSTVKMIKRTLPRKFQGMFGIGDDADLLERKNGECVMMTTDTVLEDVDFVKDEIRPEQAGYKTLAVNLSDAAAMGIRPDAFVVSLGVPQSLKPSWIKGFYRGMLPLMKKFALKCLGGDLTRSQKIFATAAVLGIARKSQAVTRADARNGDWIGVTGQLGGSLLRRQFTFVPRVEEGVFLSAFFHPGAMIDISDGFVQDLGHILRASGKGAVIDLDRIPVSRDAFQMSKDGAEQALKRALSDGEDFELLFSISPSKARRLDRVWKNKFPRVPLSWVGEISGSRNRIEWIRNGKKIRYKLDREGYRHF